MANEFQTPQESFWAGDFGDAYASRNCSSELLASNLAFYSGILGTTGKLNSVLEFGANIGMNLRALQLLQPGCKLSGLEINALAASELKKITNIEQVFEQSIFDFAPARLYDLVLIKGVLIHLNPDRLKDAYSKLYESCGKYLLVAEYYSPAPVSIPYRGHTDRLFKRDFAGEILELYPDMRLVDYGFLYRRDNAFPQDDINWFLLGKM